VGKPAHIAVIADTPHDSHGDNERQRCPQQLVVCRGFAGRYQVEPVTHGQSQPAERKGKRQNVLVSKRSTQAQHDVKDDGQCQHHTQLDAVVGVQRLIDAEPREHVVAVTNGHGHHLQHQFGNAQWVLEGLNGLGHYWFPPIAPAVAPVIDAEADTPFAAIGMSVSSGWSPGETGGALGINAVSKSIRISWAWLRSCAGSPVSTRWRLYPGSRDSGISVDSSREDNSTGPIAWGTPR